MIYYIIFFIITFSASCSTTGVIVKPSDKNPEISAVIERLNMFYSVLEHYDMRTVYVRNVIQQFFASDEDMEGWLINMNNELKNQNAYEGRIARFKIIDVIKNEESVSVRVKLWIKKRLPFLYTKIERTDEYIEIDGKWCIKWTEKLRFSH